MKKPFKSSKVFIPLIALLSSVICFSIGFAAWVIPATGDSAFATGDLVADDIEQLIPVPDDLDVITFSGPISSYKYATGYGFLVDETFVNSISLSGTCIFNSENAKKCFTSYRDDNDKSFQLEVKLGTALTNGFSNNHFVSNSIAISSANFSEPTEKIQDPTDSTYISTTFTVACLDNSTDFTFSFTVNITYTSSISSFPNLSGAEFTIEFAAKENATI